ncbi:MAG: A24 family peptidase [Gemmataceae bacterium]
MTFPAPGFAWAFAALLLAGLSAACWHDLRTLRVPKPVTLGLLAGGVLMNLIRGAWVGADGAEAWSLGPNGAAVGALDGFLFSLAGFAVGFGVFFVLWVFGVGGGGDVKLAAAVGAWVGPKLFLFVLAVALVAVTVLTLARMTGALLRGRPGQGLRAKAAPWRLLSFSLPMTLGVIVLLVLMVLPIQVRLVPAGG